MMAARRPEPDGRLDWSKSWAGGETRPCQHYGQPTFLRHPGNGRPSHKVCDDAQHLELLQPMLAGYPEIPPSFDGWYVFEKR
jgi:hypothetical protein